MEIKNIKKKFEQYQRKLKFSSGTIKFGYLIYFYKLARQNGHYTESNKTLELKSKIDSTDKEIDQMVYKLYDLTEEEIKIVEGI